MTITTLGDGRFLEVNEAFELEVGNSQEEVIGHTALELGLSLDPSERSGVMADVNDANGALTREIRFRTKAGQPMTALYSAARMISKASRRFCLPSAKTSRRASRRRRRSARCSKRFPTGCSWSARKASSSISTRGTDAIC